MSPANTTPIDNASGSTTPLAIVAATTVPNTRKATKLKTAAHTTARRGVNTRVETTVAIELAASWKPLTKSKTSAMATTAMTAKVSIDSGVLEHDAFDHVGGVLESVEGGFHRVDYVLPVQGGGGVELAGVQPRQGAAIHGVAFGFQAVDRVEMRFRSLHRLEPRDQGD